MLESAGGVSVSCPAASLIAALETGFSIPFEDDDEEEDSPLEDEELETGLLEEAEVEEVFSFARSFALAFSASSLAFSRSSNALILAAFSFSSSVFILAEAVVELVALFAPEDEVVGAEEDELEVTPAPA